MTIPVRRPRPVARHRPVTRRTAFGLRQTALGLGLVAIVVCGAGLTVRTAARGADGSPVVAVAGLLFLLVLLVVPLGGRRRAAARGAARPVAERAEEAVELPEAPEAVSRTEAPASPGPATFRSADYATMDPYDFEEAVAALCRRDGCEDVEVVGGAGDLGADVIATAPDGRRVVVQCKCYGDGNKVGSQDLQRFGGTCYAVHEAELAVVVTTSEFTEPAAEYADQCGILRVDRQALVDWTDGHAPPPWAVGHPGDAPAGGRPVVRADGTEPTLRLDSP